MNLQTMLLKRVEAGKPVRVGLIGAGKFGSMFLAQVPSIGGIEVAMIAQPVEVDVRLINRIGRSQPHLALRV